ncbi:MAG: rod shape-determining protein MreC [Oscillospiraceae bacterium]|jgi:rod shape-determining protein MreC
MKDINKRRARLIIAAAFAVAIILSAASLLIPNRAPLPRGLLNTVLQPGRALMNALAERAEAVFARSDELIALRKENSELKQRIAQMEESAREAEEVLDENERLRSLFGFAQSRRSLKFEPVTVQAWGTSNWASEFTISKGSADNIKVGDCVITETGALAGVVREVGPGWAVVATVIDTDFKMGVLIYETRETAVAEGELSRMKDGYLILTYIPSTSELRTGDTVMTSGLGGSYPSELPIGTVAYVNRDASGLTNYALILPLADYSTLSNCFVITEFNIEE